MRSRNSTSKLLFGLSLVTNGSGEGGVWDICEPPAGSTQKIITDTYAWHLSSISSVNQQVNFGVSDRSDLKRLNDLNITSPQLSDLTNQGKKLSNIQFYSGGILNKELHLNYTDVNYRMFLDQIDYMGIDLNGNVTSAYTEHSFIYNQRNLLPDPVWIFPNTGAENGIDFWGFYNGRTQNTDIPTVSVQTQGTVSENNYFPGADRSPDSEKASYGTLTQINHPTGGFSQFELGGE